MVVDTERRTGSAVHGHMARLVDALGRADDQRSRAVRYELARVIDEHLFDVHRRVKALLHQHHLGDQGAHGHFKDLQADQ